MNPPLGTTLLAPDAAPAASASLDPASVPGSVGHRLAAEGLALAYGDRAVVSDLDLQIRTGAITTIAATFTEFSVNPPSATRYAHYHRQG